MNKQLLIICSLAVAGLLSSCGASSKAPKAPQTDMVEMALPFTGAQYRTDAENYRAVQSGVSPEMSMAKKIAMQNARQEIAAAIQADISAVTENYAKSQQLPSQTKRGYEERMTELAYTVVKQTLSGITLADEKLFKEANGDYRHYVCMALSKAELEKSLLEQMQKDEKLMSDFEFDQFKKIFEQKMSEFKNE